MFSDPVKNVEQFGLALGSSVADFGSGSGHYALAAARTVGDKGKVYAIDIQKDVVVRVKNEAGKLGFHNVEIVWGDVEKASGTKLAGGVVDSVIISNLMFQIVHKDAVASEAFRVLKQGGRLLFVEWSDSFGGLGPAPEAVFTHDQALNLFSKAGFEVEREIDAGVHHYGIIFSRP